MKILKLIILFCLFSISHHGMGQSVTMSGYVRDSLSGEVLIGASIYALKYKIGTQANTYGYYSLTLPKGDSATIVVSFVGYQSTVYQLLTNSSKSVVFNLRNNTTQLSEVTVNAKNNDDNVQKAQMSVIDISIKQIKNIPMIVGERDVLKVIQFLPGVQSGNEGTTGFYVRGGNIDQNLVLLDEATVYNPNHLFGLFSTFNVNALNNVTLIKGGFPAQYGGRLSSILDITMREGNKSKFSGAGGIGLLSTNLTLEGPLQKGKSSFIVSARRSYLDLLLKSFVSGTDYFLYDLNAKVNYELGKNDHVFISGFLGKDKAAYTGLSSINYGINFGNSSGTVRWNHLFGDKVFANTSVIYSDYYLSLSTIQDKYYALLYSGIQDWTAKTSVEWYPNPVHSIKTGIQYTYHTFSPASTSNKIPKSGNVLSIKPDSIKQVYSNELAFFANDEIRISDNLGVNVGLRIPVFASRGVTYTRIEPRITAKLNVSPLTSLKIAYSEMNQFLHLIPNSTASLPTDIWISSSPLVKPQLSRQIALGVFKNFQNNDYEASVEGYYKNMENQVLFKEGTQIVLDTDLDKQLTFGKGESYGLEFFLRKNTGKLTGWVSYTLSKTTQQFAELNYGNPFPFTYDRRHNLAVVGSYELNKKWTLSGNFVFTSGVAYTLPTGRATVGQDGTLYDGIYYDYTTRNNYRLNSYNRLDVSATYHKQAHIFKKAYKAEWVFSIYNLYSRQNPYFIYLTTNPDTKIPEAHQVSLLPILPSVSYHFNF